MEWTVLKQLVRVVDRQQRLNRAQRAVDFAKHLIQANGNLFSPGTSAAGRLRPDLGAEREIELRLLSRSLDLATELYESDGSPSELHLEVACYGCSPDAEGLSNWVKQRYLEFNI